VGGFGGVDGEGGGGGGGAREAVEVDGEEREARGHEVGAVDEGEAFFGFEGDGGEAGGAERLAAWEFFVLVGAFAFAQEGEAGVGEWGEVAGGADGSDGGDGGCDAGVEEIDEALDELGADAGAGSAE